MASTTDQPEFVMVRPVEVVAYGAVAAIVLAHIRWRCEEPGVGRIEADGHRWWRVAREVLGAELGLSVKAVRGALEVLGGVVVAKRLPPLNDKSLAYRVTGYAQPLTSQKPAGALRDQPKALGGVPCAPEGRPESPQGQLEKPPGAHAPIYKTLRQEETGAPAPTSPPKLTVVGNSNDIPPLDAQFWPPPPPRCERHPSGTTAPCRQCAAAREWREKADAQDAEARTKLNRRVLTQIAHCDECDERGMVDDGDQVRRCTRHPNRDVMVKERA